MHATICIPRSCAVNHSIFHHRFLAKRSFCTDASTQQIRNQFYSNLCGPFSELIEIKHIDDKKTNLQLKSKRKRTQQPTVSKGRGVFAKKDIRKGDIVTQEISYCSCFYGHFLDFNTFHLLFMLILQLTKPNFKKSFASIV